jgi:hypothetical protein
MREQGLRVLEEGLRLRPLPSQPDDGVRAAGGPVVREQNENPEDKE